MYENLSSGGGTPAAEEREEMSGGHFWERRWGASRFLRAKRKAGACCPRPLARSLFVRKGDTVGRIVDIAILTEAIVLIGVIVAPGEYPTNRCKGTGRKDTTVSFLR
jgi:hypothetical protein